MYQEITCCRICQNTNLLTILDLGSHSLSSRFPTADEPDPIQVPLMLVKCNNTDDNTHCGLLQLKHTTSSDELYMQHYGYRSGLNNTMIQHLGDLVEEIKTKVSIGPNDVVLDIGSNDCTLLKSYNIDNLQRVGIDPTGKQFKQYYPDDVILVPTFFDQQVYNQYVTKKAKVVTSISMFYDLPSPTEFSQDIKSILADDGIWVTEQSYCVTMLENNSFDTICHEHLEYYTLKQLLYIAKVANLEIIDVTCNSCNGGSFRVTLAHPGVYKVSNNVTNMIKQEEQLDLNTLYAFNKRIDKNKQELVSFLKKEKLLGKSIYLYGASTKGNTLLQYYGLDHTLITAAAERNPEKYGRRTPGTNIPIISESDMRVQNPDYLLVLPWHFKSEFLIREKEYTFNGGTIIFPLPTIEYYN